jgi:hypothetical protein
MWTAWLSGNTERRALLIETGDDTLDHAAPDVIAGGDPSKTRQRDGATPGRSNRPWSSAADRASTDKLPLGDCRKTTKIERPAASLVGRSFIPGPTSEISSAYRFLRCRTWPERTDGRPGRLRRFWTAVRRCAECGPNYYPAAVSRPR